MSATTADRIAYRLNSYLFDKVWNSPLGEFRRNIKPIAKSPGTHTGSFFTKIGNIELPEQNKVFQLLEIPYRLLADFNMEFYSEWVRFDTVMNTTTLDIKLELGRDRIIPRVLCYGKFNRQTGLFYIAVERLPLDRIVDVLKVEDITLSLLQDRSMDGFVTYEHFKISANTSLTPLYEKLSPVSLVFVDGKYVNVDSLSAFALEGAHVEFIHDSNVMGFKDFAIDTNNIRTYDSTYLNGTGMIIHTPKNLNPDNKIITHNTGDLYVFPSDIPNANGFLISRTRLENKIEQITHNDIGISVDVVNEISNLLGTTNITLRYLLRDFDKENYLIPDKNYINILYTHDDETIVDFLCGEGPEDFDFWKANTLAQSKYTEMMFSTPTEVTSENMYDLIDAVGYHNVIDLLYNRFKYVTVNSNLPREYLVGFNSPSLNPNEAVFVYHNGLKLEDRLYKSSWSQSKGHYVTLDGEVPLQDGDNLGFEIYEFNSGIFETILVSEIDNKIKLDNSDVRVYIRDDSHAIDGIGITYAGRYVEVTDDLNEHGHIVELFDGLHIVFRDQVRGNNYLVDDGKTCLSGYKIIDNDLNILSAVTIPIGPMFSNLTPIVFLNGKRLIQDIDFSLISPKRDNELFGTELLLTNIEYLRDSNNVLEWTILREYDLNNYKDFHVEYKDVGDVVSRGLWMSSISMLNVGGHVVQGKKQSQNSLKFDEVIDYGNPYEIKTLLPSTADALVTKYHENDGTDIINAISNYLEIDSTPQFTILPQQHRIVSVYMVVVISHLLNGKLNIPLESSDAELIDLLSPYEYLKDHDIAFNSNLRFIDIQDTYVQTLGSIDIFSIVERIGNLTFSNDNVTYRRNT